MANSTRAFELWTGLKVNKVQPNLFVFQRSPPEGLMLQYNHIEAPITETQTWKEPTFSRWPTNLLRINTLLWFCVDTSLLHKRTFFKPPKARGHKSITAPLRNDKSTELAGIRWRGACVWMHNKQQERVKRAAQSEAAAKNEQVSCTARIDYAQLVMTWHKARWQIKWFKAKCDLSCLVHSQEEAKRFLSHGKRGIFISKELLIHWMV